MGQFMGTMERTTRAVGLQQDAEPTFDPHEGFNFERKIRESAITPEEFVSARIPPQFRDYCGKELMEFQVCRYKNIPLMYKCAHERHAYLNCEHQDYLIRMKEFERERRLRLRENRLVGVAA